MNPGIGTIIDNDPEPTLLGAIVVNEIGFGIGTSVGEKSGGQYPDLNPDQNYIEIRNIKNSAIGASEMNTLDIQIVGQDGSTLVVIDLLQAAGLSSIPAKGFLTIYEDGTWAISKPNGDVGDSGTFSSFPSNWNFGNNTTLPVGVNLIQDVGGSNFASVDLFVANGINKTLFIGGNTAWLDEPFDGQLGEQKVFARVFATSYGGGTDPGDAYPIDTNEAKDWTTSNEETERSYNSAPGDLNPLDSTDDFDPAQSKGTNLEDAGQTVLTAPGNGTDLSGGRGPDILIGDEKANILDGGDHNDVIDAKGGDDQLLGGKGGDLLIGGEGADELNGGSGSDTASYASSASGVNVDLNAGTASGGDATGDTLTGIENLTGSDADDTLTGDSSDNIIKGGAGADIIDGGGGDDMLFTGEGNDTITGGSGSDSIIVAESSGSAKTLDDFTTKAVSDPGDVLDLSEIITGYSNTPADPGANAVGIVADFDVSFSYDDAKTTMSVDGGGGLQDIYFNGIDLTSGGTLTAADIVEQLITDGNLDVE